MKDARTLTSTITTPSEHCPYSVEGLSQPGEKAMISVRHVDVLCRGSYKLF